MESDLLGLDNTGNTSSAEPRNVLQSIDFLNEQLSTAEFSAVFIAGG